MQSGKKPENQSQVRGTRPGPEPGSVQAQAGAAKHREGQEARSQGGPLGEAKARARVRARARARARRSKG